MVQGNDKNKFSCIMILLTVGMRNVSGILYILMAPSSGQRQDRTVYIKNVDASKDICTQNDLTMSSENMLFLSL